ncbi:hypothetical protein DSCOOX_41310 [Desulfosarcina ovata subsp. ovata]|uniref:Uncharacterized protein n=1 Tax=Desulfosarcina ovata subsp. ovata TaxID=2752305 RepID=A0A5K8AEG7_9BACT|nr:hypothetical protein DSCOOX_41310 [Desulfosarcina ovata subsp. ovata]
MLLLGRALLVGGFDAECQLSLQKTAGRNNLPLSKSKNNKSNEMYLTQAK